MKHNSLILIFLILASFGFGQSAAMNDTLPEPMAEDTISRFSEMTYPGVVPLSSIDKKLSVRMEMGTSIGLGSNSGGMYGIYASPHLSYKVSPRLRVNFGARIENTNFLNYYSPYNPYFPEFTQTFESNITRTLVYAEGQYLVNPRLMVNARVYKEVATFGEPQVNPRALDMDAEGIAVGFQYKINDNMHIGAEYSYDKGRNPYNPFYPSQFGNSSFTSPYGINRGDIFDRGGW
jgi:hypothetical protein